MSDRVRVIPRHDPRHGHMVQIPEAVWNQWQAWAHSSNAGNERPDGSLHCVCAGCKLAQAVAAAGKS